MEAFFAEVVAIPDVVRVESPYVQGGPPQIAVRQGPEAGKIVFANVELPDNISFVPCQRDRQGDRTTGAADRRRGDRARRSDLRVVRAAVVQGARSRFAIIILIVAFGSVLAMGLPVGNALFGIGIGVSIITLLTRCASRCPRLHDLPRHHDRSRRRHRLRGADRHRYREQLHARPPVRESIGTAIDTAGRSVLFAGTTVVISLMGLLLMGVQLRARALRGRGGVVAVTVAGVADSSLRCSGSLESESKRTQFGGGSSRCSPDRTRARGRRAAHPPVCRWRSSSPRSCWSQASSSVRSRREAPKAAPKPRRQTTAYRWSRVIQRRPWTAADSECARADPARDPGPELAARLLGRKQLRGPTRRPARPTTCSSTASVRDSTARGCSLPSCPRAPTSSSSRRRSPMP